MNRNEMLEFVVARIPNLALYGDKLSYSTLSGLCEDLKDMLTYEQVEAAVLLSQANFGLPDNLKDEK